MHKTRVLCRPDEAHAVVTTLCDGLFQDVAESPRVRIANENNFIKQANDGEYLAILRAGHRRLADRLSELDGLRAVRDVEAMDEVGTGRQTLRRALARRVTRDVRSFVRALGVVGDNVASHLLALLAHAFQGVRRFARAGDAEGTDGLIPGLDLDAGHAPNSAATSEYTRAGAGAGGLRSSSLTGSGGGGDFAMGMSGSAAAFSAFFFRLCAMTAMTPCHPEQPTTTISGGNRLTPAGRYFSPHSVNAISRIG